MSDLDQGLKFLAMVWRFWPCLHHYASFHFDLRQVALGVSSQRCPMSMENPWKLLELGNIRCGTKSYLDVINVVKALEACMSTNYNTAMKNSTRCLPQHHLLVQITTSTDISYNKFAEI